MDVVDGVSSDDRGTSLIYIPSPYVVSAATACRSSITGVTGLVCGNVSSSGHYNASLKRKLDDESTTVEHLRESLLNTCISKLTSISSASRSHRRRALRHTVLIHNMLLSLETSSGAQPQVVADSHRARITARRHRSSRLDTSAKTVHPMSFSESTPTESASGTPGVDYPSSISLTSSSPSWTTSVRESSIFNNNNMQLDCTSQVLSELEFFESLRAADIETSDSQVVRCDSLTDSNQSMSLSLCTCSLRYDRHELDLESLVQVLVSS